MVFCFCFFGQKKLYCNQFSEGSENGEKGLVLKRLYSLTHKWKFFEFHNFSCFEWTIYSGQNIQFSQHFSQCVQCTTELQSFRQFIVADATIKTPYLKVDSHYVTLLVFVIWWHFFIVWISADIKVYQCQIVYYLIVYYHYVWLY